MFNVLTCTIGGTEISSQITGLISNIVLILEIGIPVILVIYGMIDLGKAVMSNDEKEMKGAQSKLIRRLIYAALVFFVFVIVKLVVGFASNNNATVLGCLDEFINGPTTQTSENNVK